MQKKIEKDLFRVWLTLRSEALPSSSLIEEILTMRSNAAALKSKQGNVERRSFSLQSDLELDEAKPLLEHMNWMREKCEGCFDKVSDFLSEKGSSGELSIYVISNQAAAYFDIPSHLIHEFIDAGLTLSVKFELDEEI